MNAQAAAYLVGALVCGLLVIVVALAALLTAWRKIKEQKVEIKGLKEKRSEQDNSLREKGCDITRLEKTIENLQKNRGKRLL